MSAIDILTRELAKLREEQKYRRGQIAAWKKEIDTVQEYINIYDTKIDSLLADIALLRNRE